MASLEHGTTGPLLTLAAQDVTAVAEVAGALATVDQGTIDAPGWVARARDSWEELPVALRRAIRRFRRDSGQQGVLMLRGLPVDENSLPDTPVVDGSVQRTATIPAALLMMIACGLGDPAAFRAEKSGALVHDVVPVPGKEEFQGNAGSVLLSFHNENAFHDHRPDYVLLLCLRQDHDRVAGLRTACVRQVLGKLGERTRAALSEPQFVTQAPPSFGACAQAASHAVLSGAHDDPDLRVDFDATRALTAHAAEALEELRQAFGQAAHTHHLLPGDLAIVDNQVTVHGRTAFSPRYDGQDRWLQRTFALADLRRSRARRPADGYVFVD